MAALGYDAVTIGNHEFDFGPARLAQFIAFERSGVPFLSANTDMREEPILQSLRDNGRIADATVVEKQRRGDRHHRRLAAGDALDLGSAQGQVRGRQRRDRREGQRGRAGS